MSIAKTMGVMAIHAHNHTKFDRITSITPNALAKIKELSVINTPVGYNAYSDLRPGVYRFTIDGSEYAVIIHDNLIMSDRFIIKDSSTVFELYNGVQHHCIPYKLQQDLSLAHKGFTLNNTLDDPLDAVVLQGLSAVSIINTFDHPGSISHTTGFVAYTADKDSIVSDPIELPIKQTLKSLHDIYDEVILDRYKQRATFIKRLVDTSLTGVEEMQQCEEHPYNAESVLIQIVMPGLKCNSDLYCTHCPKIIFEEIMSGSIGICSNVNFGWNLYIRIPREFFGKDIIEFKNKLGNMYKSGNPIRIMYEPIAPIYSTVMLDEYDIPLNYKKTYIAIVPNIKAAHFNTLYNNTYSSENENSSEFWNSKYAELGIDSNAILFYKSLNLMPEE